MKLLSQFLDSELEEIHSNDIRLKTIGQLNRLPATLITKIEAAKAKTSANKSMVLNIALSYGGRQDIVSAALKIARAVHSGILIETDVTEEEFGGFLGHRGAS